VYRVQNGFLAPGNMGLPIHEPCYFGVNTVANVADYLKGFLLNEMCSI